MSETLAYYRTHASAFFADTATVDMGALQARFLQHVPSGGLLLDAGCGSGRDSQAFLARGFRVDAFDASPELAELAAQMIRQPVAVLRFEQFDRPVCYDGIWACASLLHVAQADLPNVLGRLWRALKPGGVAYLSFKLGEGERSHNGRHFTDATEDRLRDWTAALPGLARIDCWVTQDQRPGRHDAWLNALLHRSALPADKLITGDRTHPFLPALCQAISQADEIDFSVAFVKTSGLRLLLPDLQAALARPRAESSPRPMARLRILTSDYLDVTDPEALRLLLLLQEQGAKVRVFEAAGSSFHMKAYVFARLGNASACLGSAFIGSSNISRQALTDGLEWNYRVDYPGDDGFLEARNRFEAVFGDPRTQQLSDAWIDAYAARRQPPLRAIAPGSDEREPAPEPTAIQQAALQALANTRAQGFRRGLVVLATGLGKTWLAAFDAQQMGAQRVLFVAHREEILNQAAQTFLRIRPGARTGFFMGQMRETEVDVLCASVQTLGRASHLSRFAPQHFDLIVVDEFHHAAAPMYRALLRHFQPRFLLGLTATPDRSDQSDILSLCDDNLVYACDLFTGVSAGLLAPFHYYGIWDEAVDYATIPWRNGRFDAGDLSAKLATLARARHALTQWRQHAQQRTLAFCVSVRHAEYMAQQFCQAGVAAAAVHSTSVLSRGEALAQLGDGRLQVLFSVDLFNEGVDLPAIDTVLMLRPTESKVLFLQQLGRGLRLAPGKHKLVVLDFIGNHRSFLHKPQALAQLGSGFAALARFARQVQDGRLQLPAGCYVNYDLEVIEFLKALDPQGGENLFAELQQTLDRRPTLTEFYRSGGDVKRLRDRHGHWFAFANSLQSLSQPEAELANAYAAWLRELEATSMTASYKMVLLQAFQELDGWRTPPLLDTLARQSWQVLQRRRPLLADLPSDVQAFGDGQMLVWQAYWRKNPVKAWIGGNRGNLAQRFFRLDGGRFVPNFELAEADLTTFSDLVQELIDYRLASYEQRRSVLETSHDVVVSDLPTPELVANPAQTTTEADSGKIIAFPAHRARRVELPYFPDLRIACGHFRTASTEATEHRSLGEAFADLDPARYFIARARGNSMDGGKSPVRDGDYLLLELVHPGNAGSITGSVMAIEQQDDTGDNQYLLRHVLKESDGTYILRANNSAYHDLVATDSMRTLARLKAVLDPSDLQTIAH